MNNVKIHKISKSELRKLNEDDLMFITNPGRMGNEDELTFIIKNGNGLIIYKVDNSIYTEFKQYLEDLVTKYLKDRSNEDKESLKYAAIFNVWEKAFIDMVNDRVYILK